jgi:3-methyladenine DNA glycosylase AlkD
VGYLKMRNTKLFRVSSTRDANRLIDEISKNSSEHHLPWFKQGKNQYAEHDKFLGVSVPIIRTIIKNYVNMPLTEIKKLLSSPFNEIRMAGLLVLVTQYQDSPQDKIFNFYKNNLRRINNWNLVDCSAHHIVGAHLFNKEKDILYQWAKHPTLWNRRISIVSTWYFIKKGLLQDTFKLAKLLLNDLEDLIHKATGWMLREAGKQDIKLLEKFLINNLEQMPRVMLRYSIEHFPESRRIAYLSGKL